MGDIADAAVDEVIAEWLDSGENMHFYKETAMVIIVHEHYCGECKKTYECTRSVCKFLSIRKCISCQLIEVDDLLED